MLNEPDQKRAALAARLREALSPRGMKAAVAKKCGVSSQAVNGWIKTGRIDKENLLVVVELTGKSYAYFLAGEETRPSSASALSFPPAPQDSPASVQALVPTLDADSISPQERALLLMYRQLDETGRASVEEDIKKIKRMNDLERELEELKKKAG